MEGTRTMTQGTGKWQKDFSIRWAVATDQIRLRGRSVSSRRMMALVLGAALSAGGVTEAFDDVHFLVEKNLDGVRVVRKTGEKEKLVADLGSSFTASSVYKLAKAMPESLVSRDASYLELDLFQRPEALTEQVQAQQNRSVGKELDLLSDAVREQFFRTLPFGELIHHKAAKYDVDPALVAAVIEAESRFKHRARSPVGARGLMQLMPRTGRWMGARDLYDPEQNVDAGVKYLRYLDKRFNGNLKQTIAAYNAGEGTVKRYGGVPPYRETRTYVKRVLNNYAKRNRELKEFQRSSDGALAVR